jgi:hypothetical protein
MIEKINNLKKEFLEELEKIDLIEQIEIIEKDFI